MGRLLVALVFSWLLCGCVHAIPVLAFPPVGTDEPVETAPTQIPFPTTEPSEDVPSMLRTRLVARATRTDVWRVTCTLRPSLSIGGRARPLDLHVDGKACARPSQDGIAANVDGNRGVVELDVPKGSSPSEARELSQGLDDVATELARRLALAPPVSREFPRMPPPKETNRSTRWFVAAAICGGIGLVILGVGGSMMAASNDRGARGVGETLALTTALPLGVAAGITAVVALILLATE